MRILAIDLGDVRSGLAMGESTTGTIEPLRVVEARTPEQRLTILAGVVEEFGPELILVGLPLNMDGTEGSQAKAARTFADELKACTDIPVNMQDERLTSFEADQQLKGSGRSRKGRKQIQDALAAAELIRDYLATT